jgi:5-methyltetrahydrofolate--homocysteine methyltransferase
VAEWNRLAASLASEAAGPDGWVIGDVGPFGDFIEPLGDTTEEQLEAIFREQIAALAEGGADAILVETMSDPAELCVGVRAAKACTGLPVIATYAFQKSAGRFRTLMGTSTGDAIRAAFDAGADIAGANCGTDLSLDDYLDLAGEIVAAAEGRPTILQPNAGAPLMVDGGIRYCATPADMAALAVKLRATGITIVGGCCGTTPEHLAAMAASADAR